MSEGMYRGLTRKDFIEFGPLVVVPKHHRIFHAWKVIESATNRQHLESCSEWVRNWRRADVITRSEEDWLKFQIQSKYAGLEKPSLEEVLPDFQFQIKGY